jgi:hypothetical protein
VPALPGAAFANRRIFSAARLYRPPATPPTVVGFIEDQDLDRMARTATRRDQRLIKDNKGANVEGGDWIFARRVGGGKTRRRR